MTGHAYPCQSGLLADEAIALFQQFYSTQNVKGNDGDCVMSKLAPVYPGRAYLWRLPFSYVKPSAR